MAVAAGRRRGLSYVPILQGFDLSESEEMLQV
jgi:hypothetical protein